METTHARNADKVEINTISHLIGYDFFSAGYALLTMNLCGNISVASIFASSYFLVKKVNNVF